MAINHRMIETNGINMHIAEQGEGPLVILCHGFPELAYSWRHQIPALAEAGFHVVAPDQRGYGKTDRPEAIEAYHIFNLVGDIVGLVHALGEEKAVIMGHDWGAMVAYNAALLRPDVFYALGLLSVPYGPRAWGGRSQIEGMKLMAGDEQLYILYFQEPGVAEAEMEKDVRGAMIKTLYALSGDPPPEQRWNPMVEKGKGFTEAMALPKSLPSWLTEEDVDFFTEAFKETGFAGGINWYRNMHWNWEMTPFLSEAKIHQPSLFVAGEHDGVITMTERAYGNLETAMPNLTKKVLIPGAGHWVQQERPEEVNELLIEFVKNLI